MRSKLRHTRVAPAESREVPDLLANTFDVQHAVAGLLVGILVGLTGVGGGSLMTPLLVLMFGVNPQTAVGTDLLFAATTKTVGSAVHGSRETVNWRIVRRLAAGSLPASALTLFLLSYVGRMGKSTEHIMLVSLGVLLILTAVAVLFQKRLIAFAVSRQEQSPRGVMLETILLGAALGTAVSVTSVGAGALGVTALVMLYPNQPLSRIVGTDIAHAVPLTLLAGVGHWIIGDVDFGLLAALLLGSIPGVVIGSHFSSRAADAWLWPALAAVLVVSGGRLLL